MPRTQMEQSFERTAHAMGYTSITNEQIQRAWAEWDNEITSKWSSRISEAATERERRALKKRRNTDSERLMEAVLRAVVEGDAAKQASKPDRSK